MSDGNQNREVAARACGKHGVTFNQSRTRESFGQQWTDWQPSECPACQEDTRATLLAEEARRTFETDILPGLRAEIIAETDARCSAEEGFGELIEALTDSMMEKAWAEWCALNRPGFRTHARGRLLESKDAEIIEERKQKFVEAERLRVEAEGVAFAEKLATEREEKLNQALAGFAAFG